MEKHPNNEVASIAHRDKLDHIQKFEEYINKLGKKNLNLVYKKLNYLCLDFDPYDALEKSTEAQNILNEFELNQFCSNPFDFTNVILQMLDKVECLTKSRVQ